MDDTEFRLYAAEAFRQMDLLHPSIEQVADFAAGDLSGSSREEVETHLAECDQCRRRLEEYRRFVADCEAPAGKEPERDLSDEWEQLRRRIWRHRLVKALPRWGGIAAAVIAVAGLSWFTVRTLSPPPSKLLAQAYHEQRTSEFRLAGAEHSEVRRQRGGQSAFRRPPALLKPQAKLAESNQDDPEVLRLKGEAQMMAGDAAEAVQTLEMARDLRAEDARILADLGTAYALRGDSDHQAGDWLTGLDFLGRSDRLKPGVPETVFNLALALERNQLKDQAIAKWEEYLRVDSNSGWAKEAQQHLADLQATLKSREDALHQILDDPEQFLALVAGRSHLDAEAYLTDIAVSKWLPRVTSHRPTREATILLARILKERHEDSWLENLLASIDRSHTIGGQGVEQLALARRANAQGDAGSALKAASRAEDIFRGDGCQPGILWARYEQEYSLGTLGKLDEAVRVAEGLARDLEPLPYSWLRAYSLIDYSVRLRRVGRLSEAAVGLRKAIDISQKASLGEAALRARGSYLDVLGYVGLSSEVFAGAADSLRTFWTGAYSGRRFNQVVDKVRVRTSDSGETYASYYLARSGVWATSAENPIVAAPARANLAAACQAIGEDAEARENLVWSEKLLAQLQGDRYAAYRLEPQIDLANVELQQGDPSSALRRLEGLLDRFDNPPTLMVGVEYYAALGEARRRNGSLLPAISAFQKSIDFGTRRIQSLASEPEQAGEIKTLERSYRGLVAATISLPGGDVEGLRLWRSFRALHARIAPDLARRPEGTVLWFAQLPDEFVAWLTTGDVINLKHLSASNANIAAVASRFSRECSDPASSLRSVREDARKLYEWMVEPFAPELQHAAFGQPLIFELDGVLTSVPVNALMSSDGRCLGEWVSAVVSSGYGTPPSRERVDSTVRVLVIANPALAGEAAIRFPPLPESRKEAESIRSEFTATSILEGRGATIDAFEAALPSADLIHFAGHGYSDSKTGALLFAPKDPRLVDYDPLRSVDLLRQDWSRCRLAVLSACGTASGETRGASNPESLVRAIIRAGGSRVAATLWNADSASIGEIMASFYTSLAIGETIDEALRKAQQIVRQRPDWVHPYYWAGVQLYVTI